MNYEKYINERYDEDVDSSLSLIEINLQNYRDGRITDAGLSNIEDLFRVLSHVDKQLIVRFLYDLNGENDLYEPEGIETILTHMEQLAPVLEKFSNEIFIIQGLFIGHWGEMHGTKYSTAGDMQRLAEQLNEMTDSSIYLSVRTPSQWRQITGLEGVMQGDRQTDTLVRRLGLFNDGMLASESDYGTYEIKEDENGERTGREEELAFQEELCRLVPNGGEVICDNLYNDFDNAVQDLATMHVTYLNSKYDKEVLDKWARAVVSEEGCFDGMDGLTYVERRLGYRLYIADASVDYTPLADHMTVSITMRNAGFAPIYKEPEMILSLYNRESKELHFYRVEGNLCSLSGGNDAEDYLNLEAVINISKLSRIEYEMYFMIFDTNAGQQILLANEQEEQRYGYFIGTVEPENGVHYLSNWLTKIREIINL